MGKRGDKRRKRKKEKAKSTGAPGHQPRNRESAPGLPATGSPESRWSKFWLTILAGIVLLMIGIVVSPLYSARMTLPVNAEGKTEPPTTKMVERDTSRPGVRVSLLEAVVRVRNDGLKGGRIHDCETRPSGVLTPKVEIIKTTSPVIGPFQTGHGIIQYRVTETKEIAPYDFQYQIACNDPDGSPAFHLYMLWKAPHGWP